MKTYRSIETVLAPPPPHMVGDGFRVHHFFPGGPDFPMDRMSPFFMLDYNALTMLPPSPKPKGVGVHPHRGFETVTIAYKGRIAHHDSAGNSGVIGEGDVQWMTAGSGVLHKEFHEEEFSKAGGAFQMVQLWVNLPAKYKMHAPKYQEITSAQMGRVALQKGHVEIIAGEFQGVKGPASTFSPVHLYNLKLESGDRFETTFPSTYRVALLAISGNARYQDGTAIPQDHFALLRNDGDNILIESEGPATVLLLAGEPLHEPIAAYGPFVMNTKAEILQAYDDFQAGKFGKLEED
ncbi:MAG TPA: pirin family protein [Saprospiraceae bacterium]|nr:pirin family protein [Saprospiraceae bacterium]